MERDRQDAVIAHVAGGIASPNPEVVYQAVVVLGALCNDPEFAQRLDGQEYQDADLFLRTLTDKLTIEETERIFDSERHARQVDAGGMRIFEALGCMTAPAQPDPGQQAITVETMRHYATMILQKRRAVYVQDVFKACTLLLNVISIMPAKAAFYFKDGE